MSDPEFTKDTLIARIQTAREAFDATLARVPEKEMQIPVLHDGWLVKDMLAHLGYWEERAVQRFKTLRAGETPAPVTDLDELNEQALVEGRMHSVEVVRRRELEAYVQLLNMVREASPDELFTPSYFAGAPQNAFVDWIAGNTWEHYDEHLPEVVAWLDAEKDS